MAVVGFAIAVLLALGIGGLALAIGPSLGFVDRPDTDGLKTHTHLAVPLGGAAVMIGLHGGLLTAGAFDPALFVSTLFIWLMGLTDDRFGLSPYTRLAGSAIGGVLLVAIGGRHEGFLAGLAGVVLVVVSVNAVNLLDGLDGLAGTIGAVAAVGLAAFAYYQGRALPWASIILTGALVGFLYWNVAPARLFLGDNGAYVVGVALAWASLRSSVDWGSGLVAAALIGVPLIDLAATVLSRIVRRAQLFEGDRDHVYDRLIRSGWTAGRVVLLYAAVQAVWATMVVAFSYQAGDMEAAVAALFVGGILLTAGAFINGTARSDPGRE